MKQQIQFTKCLQQQEQRISLIKPRSTNKQKINIIPKAQKLTQEVFNHMIKQLDLGIIVIPQQQQPFKIKKRQKNNKQIIQKSKQQLQKQLIQRLQQQRRQALIKLMTIQRQERQIKLNHKRKHIKKNRRYVSQRSLETTKQQSIKVQQIIKRNKQYHNFLLNQTQIVIKNQVRRKIEQQRQHVQSIQKIKSQRRKIAQQKLKILKDQKQQRLKQIKQNKSQKYHKNQKYIFQINLEKQKEKKAEEEKQIQKKLKLIRQKFKLNIQQIKNHQVQYIKQKQKKLQQLLKQQNNSSYPMKKHKLNYSTNMRAFEQNIFTKIIKQQQRLKKQQRKQKEQQGKQKRNKINQFQKYVKDKFKPKSIKSKQYNDSQIIGDHISRRLKSLSHQQINNLGKKYLSIARMMKKNEEDQLIDYNPFQSNIELKQIINKQINRKEYKNKTQFQEVISKFFTNSNINASINMNNKNKIRIKSEQTKQAIKTNDSSTYKLNTRIDKDEKLYESIKNKLDFLRFIQ